MKKYKPYLNRVDLVKNQVEREELREQEAKRKRSRSIQEQNKQRWLKYQEQLRSELAARYFHSVMSTGGESFSNTQSLLFDGIDDFVRVANDASINFASEFSVSMWFKTTSSNVMYAITHGSSSEIKYLIQFYAPINRIRLQIFDVSNVATIIDNTQVFNDGQWHHLAFTTDGTTTSDKVIVYFDGSPLTNKGTLSNNGIRLTTLSLSIGQVPNTARFNGNIDEVALFNSELSSTDITSIYNGNGAGKPGDLASLNPVSWWRFEEGSGTTATDSGTGGNNGTLLGGPTYSTDIPG